MHPAPDVAQGGTPLTPPSPHRGEGAAVQSQTLAPDGKGEGADVGIQEKKKEKGDL